MKTKFSLLMVASVVGLGLTAGSASAGTITYGVHCVTGNNASNCSFGEQYFFVDGVDNGDGTASFTVRNTAPRGTTSITELYFMANPEGLLSNGQVGSAVGNVSFDNGGSNGVNPPSLPGAGSVVIPAGWWTTTFTSLSSNEFEATGSTDTGIGAGESLTINFNFTGSSLDFSNVLVGMHVRSFANGGSESFVTTPPGDPVPEPATGALLLAGVGMLAARARARRRRQ